MITQTDAICVSRSVRTKPEFALSAFYRHRVGTKKALQRSQWRVVPASLFPYGGFGDPEVHQPYLRAPKGTANDSVLQAVVQDRLARFVRRELQRRQMSDADLERELDYRRYGLVRKLNGNEQITMRDVARLGTFFGPSVLGALSVADTDVDSPANYVQEGEPVYPSDKDELRDLIADASACLVEAGKIARKSKSAQDRALAEVLGNLSKTLLSLGTETPKSRSDSKKPKGTRK